MAKIYNHVLETIGRTPLIRLNQIAQHVSSVLYAKVEYFNPGGSVKDRVGLAMITNAEKDGLLKPGGTIVEATAGNTGVGLAMAAAIKGYKTIFVLPDKMSEEKINLLKAYGAEVVVTPTNVPPDSPESYNGVADRLAREIPNAYRPNQFENPNNPLAHYLTTGPEIWEDTDGEIDVFVAGMGTGGTISGAGKYLKEQKPSLTIVGADPEGSILSGDTPKSYKVEGIGEDFIPKTFNRQVVDEMIRVSDLEAFQTARNLARLEGILAGGSSGTALAAALKYAQRLSSPQNIVVLLPDTGRNYLSKFFSDTWMKENGFWSEGDSTPIRVWEILRSKNRYPAILSLNTTDKLSLAVKLFSEYGVSQLPVVENQKVVGHVNEASLMKSLHDGLNFNNQSVSAVMGKALPCIDENTDTSEAYRLLLSGNNALVVLSDKTAVGIITRVDLINFWLNKIETNTSIKNS